MSATSFAIEFCGVQRRKRKLLLLPRCALALLLCRLRQYPAQPPAQRVRGEARSVHFSCVERVEEDTQAGPAAKGKKRLWIDGKKVAVASPRKAFNGKAPWPRWCTSSRAKSRGPRACALVVCFLPTTAHPSRCLQFSPPFSRAPLLAGTQLPWPKPFARHRNLYRSNHSC